MSVADLADMIVAQELLDYLLKSGIEVRPDKGDSEVCVGEVDVPPRGLVRYVYRTTRLQCPTVYVDLDGHWALPSHVKMYKRKPGDTGADDP